MHQGRDAEGQVLAERSGGAQHPLAVPEQNTRLFEIRLDQFRQDFKVDRILAKTA